jgi:hypothetical protein
MSTGRSSDLDLRPPAARYLSPRAALIVSAILGGLVILALTAASAGVYDAVAEKDGISGPRGILPVLRVEPCVR